MRRIIALTCIVLTLLVCNANAQHVRETQEYVDAAYARMWRQEHRHAEQPLLLATPPPCCQWTPPVVIDTSTAGLTAQVYAALAVSDSGHLFAAWMDVRNWFGNTNQIVTAFSTDKGSTWRRSVPFTNLYWCAVRDIAFDRQGNIWLLWTSGTNEFGPFFLNLSKSTNAGQTFSTAFTSREYAGAYFQSKLAIDMANNVFMLWDDQQFKLTRFRNGDIGQRMDTEIPNDTLRVDFWCSLAVGVGANIYALWTGVQRIGPGQDRYRVYCSTSTDTGTIFVGRTRIDTTEFPFQFYGQGNPASTIDRNGLVHVSFVRQIGIPDSTSMVSSSSSDSGKSFKTPVIVMELGSNSDPSMTVDATNSVSILWSGNGGAYFSRSTDSGQTFSRPQLIYAGRPDMVADRIGNLFAVFETSQRIKFARTNVLVSVATPTALAAEINLEQNYPNPFNPVTTIRFELPSAERVTLCVYNLLGQEVAVVLNDMRDAGYHQATFDGSGLPSGLYFYRLTAGSFSAVKKLVLLR